MHCIHWYNFDEDKTKADLKKKAFVFVNNRELCAN